MSAVEAITATHGRRWMTPIQRVQNPLAAVLGVALRRRANMPGLPIRWPKNVSSAGSKVSDAASTSNTASEEATASP